ncbi:MAG: hypothetical protein U9N85_07930 [Bacteroidota bacterium]|nr:hypothetical protein [Bacteroidota bacterium]
MKHIKLTIFGIIIIFSACKFDEQKYSFVREFDSGTYLTPQGAAKYISGLPDTASVVRDVYAKVEEAISFAAPEEQKNIDSILVYGHAWGTSPKARLTDSTSTAYMIDENLDAIPDSYMSFQNGDKFESVLINLVPETAYYVRSYVITGSLEGGQPSYRDTAFNPVELEITTAAPKDVWEQRRDYDGNSGDGAVSFVYNDEIYVGLLNNKFGIFPDIYKYNAQTDTWSFVSSYPGTEVSNAAAFVINNVRVNIGVYKDFVYIGSGFSVNGNDTIREKEFWRWEIQADDWVKLKDGSVFSGIGREEAIAFTIDGKGYFGLGEKSTIEFDDFWQFDPTLTDSDHPQGTWLQMTSFRPGPRTKAATFTIADNGFVCCGQDRDGLYTNDLWMFKQTTNGNGDWVEKAPFPSTARIDAAGFTIEDFGYIGTGIDRDSLCSDFWRYNPFTDTWLQRAFYTGGPRRSAVGEGIKYGENDFRGYLGLGRGPLDTDYYEDLWQYRP